MIMQGLCTGRACWLPTAEANCVGERKDANQGRRCFGRDSVVGRYTAWGANVSIDCPCRSGRAACVSEDRFEDGEVIIDKNGMRFVRKPLMRVSLSGPDDDVISLASTWSDSPSVPEPPSSSSNQPTHGQTTRPGGLGLLPKAVQPDHSEAVADWVKSQTVISNVRRPGWFRSSESHFPKEDMSQLIQTGTKAKATRKSPPMSFLDCPPPSHSASAGRQKKAAGELLAQFEMYDINTMLSKIRRVGRVGRGSSGTVWEVCLQDGKAKVPLALKEVPLPDDECKRAMIVKEMRMLKETDHPCIVECYGVFFSKNNFQMVMELVDGGSLLDLMQAAQSLIPHEAIGAVAFSVCSALAFLHDECRVVHRDVKPGNILLSLSGKVKLADLGICTLPGEAPSTEWLGTVMYMSPERMVGEEYSYSADVWSVGLVVMQAAMGNYPFTTHVHVSETKQMEFWDLLDLMISGPSPACILEGAGVGASSEMKEFVAMCMNKEKMERPTAAECLGLPFLSSPTKQPVREAKRKQALAEWVQASHKAKAAMPPRDSCASSAGEKEGLRDGASSSSSQGDGNSRALQDLGNAFKGLFNML